MLKHFSGTPDSIPEDKGYQRAVCRLQLIGEHSSGSLLLDCPLLLHDPVHPIVKFLGDPVRPIVELGSNIEKETTGDNTFPKPTASPGSEHARRPPPTGLIFIVSLW
jgi:hypothetical protein